MTNPSPYPTAVKEGVKALCEVLEKHYPKVFNQLYDQWGMPCTVGALFQQRMEMGVYFELAKAGVLSEQTEKVEKD